MDYKYFNRITFLQEKIKAFEQSHYEKELELIGFSSELEKNRDKEKVKESLANYEAGIKILRIELEKEIAQEKF